MLSDKQINEALVEILTNRISKKTELANFISDMLTIEKETAYRRLRGVSMFTFSEVAVLSQKLNFSLDEIVMSIQNSENTTNMTLHSFYSDKKNEKNEYDSDFMNFIFDFVKSKDAELGMALKSIPFQLVVFYPHLSNYYKYKYMLHIKNRPQPISFKEIKSSPDWYKNSDSWEKTYKAFYNIPLSIYIWDRKNISTITNDIKYFKSLNLIDDDNTANLKKELLAMLDDIEKTASIGMHEETGTKCDIYISDEDIDTSYCYFWSEKRCMSLLITHLLYSIVSYNNKIKCEEMRNWIASMKYNSTPISGTGAKERVLFFKQQRDIVRTL